MVRVAVHVGAHKTGTSLIQKFMRDKPEQIEPHGIRVVGRGDTNDLIGWGSVLIEHPDKLAGRIESEASKAGTRYVVVSHENTLGRPFKAKLDSLYPEAGSRAKALGAILKPWDHRVLFYIRRQADFLESYYLQLVQQGSLAIEFDEWLETMDLDAVSWRPAVSALREAVGSDRVVVAGFDEIRGGQESFLDRFFRRIDEGLSLSPAYEPVRNVSISDKGLRVALAAAPHLRTPEERKAMRVFLQKHFSNLRYPRPTLLSDEQKQALSERYDSEYSELTSR